MSAAPRRHTGPLCRARAGALAVLAAAALGACTDDSDSSEDPSQPGAGGTVSELGLAAEPAQQRTRVRKVWGRWPADDDSARTRSLERATGRVVGAWINRAFVAADYPTSEFDHAFSTFTRGAAAQARRDSWLTTNQTLGDRLVDAVPVQRTVWITAFAPKGSAVGATAEVALVLHGLGESGRRSKLSVTGELHLSRFDGSWRIFGYDLQRSVRAAGSQGAAGGGG